MICTHCQIPPRCRHMIRHYLLQTKHGGILQYSHDSYGRAEQLLLKCNIGLPVSYPSALPF